jgi:hypothetical protein
MLSLIHSDLLAKARWMHDSDSPVKVGRDIMLEHQITIGTEKLAAPVL